MKPIEIIVIILCVIFVFSVIIVSIINKKKGKNSCGYECSNCTRCCSKIYKEKAKKS